MNPLFPLIGIFAHQCHNLRVMKHMICVAVTALAVASGSLHGAMTVDYSGYDRLLHRYVKDGTVNYEGFRKEAGVLQAFLDEITSIHPEGLGSQEAQMACWINTYNACVIKGVLDHTPLQSVMKIPGFFDKITYTVGGESLSLNQIETRGRAFHDPRIHFAVVCASSSCPLLRPEAYVPERLKEQLQDQARGFLANAQRGLRLDEAAGVAHLSQIFKWYATDFVSGGVLTKLMGSDKIIKALEPYMDDITRRKVVSRTWKIDYMPYDWTLNKRS